MVEYLGDVNGRWKGPLTCHQYEFRREKHKMYVDNQELPHFAKLRDVDGKALFRRCDVHSESDHTEALQQ